MKKTICTLVFLGSFAVTAMAQCDSIRCDTLNVGKDSVSIMLRLPLYRNNRSVRVQTKKFDLFKEKMKEPWIADALRGFIRK